MIHVTKRDGTREPLNISKIDKVLEWACEGVKDVSVSEIELRSQIQFYDGITTGEITDIMIKAAADLITVETPNYQNVAGNLINYNLRKEVYGKFEPDHLFDHVRRVVDLGFYDEDLLFAYEPNDWELLNDYIDHGRDFDIVYAGMEQMRSKYLVKNRHTGKVLETPQIANMLIAMGLFRNEERGKRLGWVKAFYDALSTFEINLPTPIMAGVRTPEKQYSSCVLIDVDDSLDSIIASTGTIVKYVSQRAGIGLNGGRIRAVDSPVKGGAKKHTGLRPYWRLFNAGVNSVNQGGIRKGSATVTYAIWHKEVEDLLVLKNVKGTDESRIPTLDYCVQLSRIFYERLMSGGKITLFSPSDVPGLLDAFYSDQDKFRELYERYEADPTIPKKVVDAQDLFSTFMQERKDTGRVYFMNVDNVNDHGAFIPEVAPITMTNLCVEINLPTKPQQDLWDEDAEVALCILSATNVGRVKTKADFQRTAKLIVRALDNLIDLQEYPIPAAENAMKRRRSIGVGVVNLAYWLAKTGNNYQDPDLDAVDELFETWSYYLIKASADLAVERGPCPAWLDTKYSKGLLPIHTYKRTVDELVTPKDRGLDWEGLSDQIRITGIRNSTLMAQMPAETSAVVSNSTNGMEPPPALVTSKQSKDIIAKQVVPELKKLRSAYDLRWDQPNPRGYLKIAAVMQKWMDQAMSVNFSYNPKFYENEEIPMSDLLGDLIFFYRYGGKDGYYLNVHDGAGEIVVDDDCDACKL